MPRPKPDKPARQYSMKVEYHINQKIEALMQNKNLTRTEATNIILGMGVSVMPSTWFSTTD